MPFRLRLAITMVAVALSGCGGPSSSAAPTPRPVPAGRLQAAVAPLPGADGILVYGGLGVTSDGISSLHDTWFSRKGAWSPGPSGPALSFPLAAATPDGRGVLLIGRGDEQNSPGAETWLFDGSTWKELKPADEFSAAIQSPSLVAASGGRLLLWGQLATDPEGGVSHGAGFTWDGGTWTRLEIPEAQANALGPTAVATAADGRMIGVAGTNVQVFGDTGWSDLGITAPSGIVTMTTDTRNRRVVAVTPAGLSFFDGSAWTSGPALPSPADRGGVSLSDDPAAGGIALVGGISPASAVDEPDRAGAKLLADVHTLAASGGWS